MSDTDKEGIWPLIKQVREEMKKDGYDLMEQVTILILGGVLGGHAFQVAQSNSPMIVDLIVYIILFSTGYLVLAMIHFVISLQRITDK